MVLQYQEKARIHSLKLLLFHVDNEVGILAFPHGAHDYNLVPVVFAELVGAVANFHRLLLGDLVEGHCYVGNFGLL